MKKTKYEQVGGKMLGLVMLGREESVEVDSIYSEYVDSEYLKDGPYEIIHYSGKGLKDKVFFRNFRIPVGCQKYYFHEPLYSGSTGSIKFIDNYTFKRTVASIHIKVERETFLFGFVRKREVVTDIIGNGVEGADFPEEKN